MAEKTGHGSWVVCAAALRFTKRDNRHGGRGALVKERVPLLSFLGESGTKNSKGDRAKYTVVLEILRSQTLQTYNETFEWKHFEPKTKRYLGVYRVYTRGFPKMG